jgi:arylsulfatase B
MAPVSDDLIFGDGDAWPDRSLVVELQRVVNPEKWRKCVVMTNQWRLIDGKELYDMSADSGQAKDVAEQYPEVVQACAVITKPSGAVSPASMT